MYRLIKFILLRPRLIELEDGNLYLMVTRWWHKGSIQPYQSGAWGTGANVVTLGWRFHDRSGTDSRYKLTRVVIAP